MATIGIYWQQTWLELTYTVEFDPSGEGRCRPQMGTP